MNIRKDILVVLMFGLIVLSFWVLSKNIGIKPIPKPDYPNVKQRVNILTSEKQGTLEFKWILENEEDLKSGKLRFADNPYNEDKIVYQLKTSLDSLSSFVYGSQSEIERLRCSEYNKFITIRKTLVSLNKPKDCK